MLGVVTSLELEVTAAYRLKQQVAVWPWEEVIGRWGELVGEHRHFGFFWLPTEDSAALYNLASHGEMADKCYVKIYDEATAEDPDGPTPGRRTDRCYRIYPMVYDPNFHELEYFVPLEQGPAALAATRELMLRSLPDTVSTRWRCAPSVPTMRSLPNYHTPTTVISVRASPGPTTGTTYAPSTRCSRSSTPASTGASCTSSPGAAPRPYPAARDFIAVRRELDPDGIFLNDHLRALFA